MLDCITGKNDVKVSRDDRDDAERVESQRWCLARPPFAGEISSEEKPEPASALLLHVAAKPAGRRRPTPRIWTPADEIAVMVPRSVPVEEQLAFYSCGGEEAAPRKRARSAADWRTTRRERERAAEHLNREIQELLAISRHCSKCGKPMDRHGVFSDRPIPIGEPDNRTLACRGCVFGGRHLTASEKAAL
jgi:hypothetical protein